MRILKEEHDVLKVLQSVEGKLLVTELAERLGIDQSLVMAAVKGLEERGLLAVEERTYLTYALGPLGESVQGKELPERKALQAIHEAEGGVRVQEIGERAGLSDDEAKDAVRWLMKRGWCRKDPSDGALFVLSDLGVKALDGPDEDEKVIQALSESEPRTGDELAELGVDMKRALSLLKSRSGAVKEKKRADRFVFPTDEGKGLDLSGVQVVREASQLTHEMLVSGEWKDVAFKRYDVTLESARVQPGKTHPLRKIIDEVRHVFLEMGFTEIESPLVDTAFWVFDALFQPQDHPAREMQDTFFTKVPKHGRLPDPGLVRAVKEVHETGGDTGSFGWRYDWSEERARRVVLRTHTTATTIRYLAEHPDPPSKVFIVDRVFRREKATFKHLPEFTQVDGIIVDEGASLSTLLGTLTEFYRKMGVTELKFRPSFFPYTEPSAEPYALFRGKWMELGGSGVFRPEVTRPLGCKVPVLAWGLGLERLAMVRFGVKDIRELYFTDLDFVRGIPLCR